MMLRDLRHQQATVSGFGISNAASQRVAGQKRKFGTSLSANTNMDMANAAEPNKKRCRYNLRPRGKHAILPKLESQNCQTRNMNKENLDVSKKPPLQLRRSKRLAQKYALANDTTNCQSIKTADETQKQQSVAKKDNTANTDSDGEDVNMLKNTNKNQKENTDNNSEGFEIFDDNDNGDKAKVGHRQSDIEGVSKQQQEPSGLAQPKAKQQEKEKAKTVSPWDKPDTQNDLCVIDYVDDIVQHLRVSEAGAPKVDYAAKSPNVNYRMRTILVDWLISVHRKFKLAAPTLYLGVDILDRYLAAKPGVSQDTLQLIGCASLWVASKYHDIYAPEIGDFVYISDSAFTGEQLAECELDILSALSFDVTVATALPFAQRFIKVATHDLKLQKKQHASEVIEALAYYLIEHSMMDYEHTHMFAPSLIAAASVAIALLGCNVYSQWPPFLAAATGYTLVDLVPVMRQLDASRCLGKHESVNRKYSSQQMKYVAKMKFEKLNHTKYFGKDNRQKKVETQ